MDVHFASRQTPTLTRSLRIEFSLFGQEFSIFWPEFAFKFKFYLWWNNRIDLTKMLFRGLRFRVSSRAGWWILFMGLLPFPFESGCSCFQYFIITHSFLRLWVQKAPRARHIHRVECCTPISQFTSLMNLWKNNNAWWIGPIHFNQASLEWVNIWKVHSNCVNTKPPPRQQSYSD